MSEPVLQIDHLTKRFRAVTAVDQLDLTVRRGQVFGILGPNGSGKTTTLAMLLGIIYPTSGTYTWFGNLTGHEARLRIGTLLETPNFYPGLSASRNLRIVAEIKKIKEPEIDRVLEQVGLLERAHSPFRTFSLGMKQRLAIGAALLGNPEILVLDEPTNGLDPQGIAEIRTLIRNLSGQSITIILASHLLDEVQKVCTDVCIMRKGRLLYTGNLQAAAEDAYYIEMTAPDLKQLETVCRQHPGIVSVSYQEDKLSVRVQNQYNVADVHRFLIEKGIVLTYLHNYAVDLENKYLEIIQ